MAFLEWETKYSVGILSIDAQHQHLFELINQFYESIRQKHTEQALADLLKGLLDYTKTHFLTEENYLKKYQYPLYEKHLAKHGEFIERLHEMQIRFQNRQLLLPIEIAEFVKQWLAGHVLGEDQRYAHYLQEKMAHAPESKRP
jgi:hemerythrin